jgi:hypothetical protein
MTKKVGCLQFMRRIAPRSMLLPIRCYIRAIAYRCGYICSWCAISGSYGNEKRRAIGEHRKKMAYEFSRSE